MDKKVHQVVIIGAGVSGLSAARHLVKNGIEDILIIEATDKAGGRIQTVKFGRQDNDSEPGLVELGAQWIHGEQNELCQLIKSSNHRHSKTSWEGKGDFLCPNGDRLEKEVVDEVLGWIEEAIEKVEATFSIDTLQKGAAISSGPHSMGHHLQEGFNAYLQQNYSHLQQSHPEELENRKALFQWGMSFQRIDNSCRAMNDVSLFRWSEFQVNPGEHYNNFAQGAQSFIDEILVEDLLERIVYNSPVVNITWKTTQDDLEPTKISLKDERIFLCETVLVTCSIGVLQSSLESLFTPSLPQRQRSAIESTGFGPVTKIFLEWEEPWWPKDLQGFQLVWPETYIDSCEERWSPETLDESWPKTITGFDPVLNNPCVLLAWLGGMEGIYAEGLSEDEVIRRCTSVLKEFTGQQIPNPIRAAVSKWNTNEYFRGAYSYRSVQGDRVPGDICGVLCEPVTAPGPNGEARPVILFAGEALSKTHYSTLHGAFESGIAQASKLVQYFSTKTSPKTLIAKTNDSSLLLHNHNCKQIPVVPVTNQLQEISQKL